MRIKFIHIVVLLFVLLCVLSSHVEGLRSKRRRTRKPPKKAPKKHGGPRGSFLAKIKKLPAPKLAALSASVGFSLIPPVVSSYSVYFNWGTNIAFWGVAVLEWALVVVNYVLTKSINGLVVLAVVLCLPVSIVHSFVCALPYVAPARIPRLFLSNLGILKCATGDDLVAHFGKQTTFNQKEWEIVFARKDIDAVKQTTLKQHAVRLSKNDDAARNYLSTKELGGTKIYTPEDQDVYKLTKTLKSAPQNLKSNWDAVSADETNRGKFIKNVNDIMDAWKKENENAKDKDSIINWKEAVEVLVKLEYDDKNNQKVKPFSKYANKDDKEKDFKESDEYKKIVALFVADPKKLTDNWSDFAKNAEKRTAFIENVKKSFKIWKNLDTSKATKVAVLNNLVALTFTENEIPVKPFANIDKETDHGDKKKDEDDHSKTEVYAEHVKLLVNPAEITAAWDVVKGKDDERVKFVEGMTKSYHTWKSLAEKKPTKEQIKKASDILVALSYTNEKKDSIKPFEKINEKKDEKKEAAVNEEIKKLFTNKENVTNYWNEIKLKEEVRAQFILDVPVTFDAWKSQKENTPTKDAVTALLGILQGLKYKNAKNEDIFPFKDMKAVKEEYKVPHDITEAAELLKNTGSWTFESLAKCISLVENCTKALNTKADQQDYIDTRIKLMDELNKAIGAEGFIRKMAKAEWNVKLYHDFTTLLVDIKKLDNLTGKVLGLGADAATPYLKANLDVLKSLDVLQMLAENFTSIDIDALTDPITVYEHVKTFLELKPKDGKALMSLFEKFEGAKKKEITDKIEAASVKFDQLVTEPFLIAWASGENYSDCNRIPKSDVEDKAAEFYFAKIKDIKEHYTNYASKAKTLGESITAIKDKEFSADWSNELKLVQDSFTLLNSCITSFPDQKYFVGNLKTFSDTVLGLVKKVKDKFAVDSPFLKDVSFAKLLLLSNILNSLTSLPKVDVGQYSKPEKFDVFSAEMTSITNTINAQGKTVMESWIANAKKVKADDIDSAIPFISGYAAFNSDHKELQKSHKVEFHAMKAEYDRLHKIIRDALKAVFEKPQVSIAEMTALLDKFPKDVAKIDTIDLAVYRSKLEDSTKLKTDFEGFATAIKDGAKSDLTARYTTLCDCLARLNEYINVTAKCEEVDAIVDALVLELAAFGEATKLSKIPENTSISERVTIILAMTTQYEEIIITDDRNFKWRVTDLIPYHSILHEKIADEVKSLCDLAKADSIKLKTMLDPNPKVLDVAMLKKIYQILMDNDDICKKLTYYNTKQYFKDLDSVNKLLLTAFSGLIKNGGALEQIPIDASSIATLESFIEVLKEDKKVLSVKAVRQHLELLLFKCRAISMADKFKNVTDATDEKIAAMNFPQLVALAEDIMSFTPKTCSLKNLKDDVLKKFINVWERIRNRETSIVHQLTESENAGDHDKTLKAYNDLIAIDDLDPSNYEKFSGKHLISSLFTDLKYKKKPIKVQV